MYSPTLEELIAEACSGKPEPFCVALEQLRIYRFTSIDEGTVSVPALDPSSAVISFGRWAQDWYDKLDEDSLQIVENLEQDDDVVTVCGKRNGSTRIYSWTLQPPQPLVLGLAF